jgi:hypothetical protein
MFEGTSKCFNHLFESVCSGHCVTVLHCKIPTMLLAALVLVRLKLYIVVCFFKSLIVSYRSIIIAF